MASVKGVLFDSGGVLIRPIGGRWNPRLDFEPTVLEVAPQLTEEEFRRAFAVGDRYWDSTPIPEHSRAGYHRAILAELGVTTTDDLLARLDLPLDPTTVVEPYPEVVALLDALTAAGMRMAVVSDNSPNLQRLHAGIGIAHHFEAYAISALLGCTKPDPRMYAYASDALGLDPGDCLFVDDLPDLVAAAIDLGYRGVAVLRDSSTQHADVDVPTISDLTELWDHL